MEVGISTACLYPMLLEESMKLLCELRPGSIEIFINSAQELEKPYIDSLIKIKEYFGVKVRSVHPFSSPFEPMLFFSEYERRFYDGVELYKKFFLAANMLGADILVFHGDLLNTRCSFPLYVERFGRLSETAKEMGIILAQENVSRCKSRSPEFIADLKKQLPDVKFVLDTKQAVRAGYEIWDILKAMGPAVCHVHVSDHDGLNCCMPPGKGTADFGRLARELRSYNFNGCVIIEMYRENFNFISDLTESMDELKKII